MQGGHKSLCQGRRRRVGVENAACTKEAATGGAALADFAIKAPDKADVFSIDLLDARFCGADATGLAQLQGGVFEAGDAEAGGVIHAGEFGDPDGPGVVCDAALRAGAARSRMQGFEQFAIHRPVGFHCVCRVEQFGGNR